MKDNEIGAIKYFFYHSWEGKKQNSGIAEGFVKKLFEILGCRIFVAVKDQIQN